MSSDTVPRLLKGQRVLVTGASGQLGRYLVPALNQAGSFTVKAGSRPGPGIDVAADLSQPVAARRLVQEAAPDLIIHAAACTDVDGIEREPRRGELGNVVATQNVAEAATACGAYLIAVSTDMVFSGTAGAPYDEHAEPSPINAYGASKLKAERIVLAASPAFAVARTAWLYGGGGKHFPRTVVSILRDRGGIDVVDDERGSPTYAGDLAVALISLAKTRGGGIFHLVNAGSASRFALAQETARLAGFDPVLVKPVSTSRFLDRYPLPARRPPDSTLQNCRGAALGIRLRAWPEALAAYVPVLATELGVAERAD
jgi:dTDP-4-dehydrorhamnose reductase